MTQNAPAPLALPRSLVLIGMPGSGKSTVGRRLAARLGLPFVDSDNEIVAAAGLSIPEIFEKHGEGAFRDGERKVIARLLGGERQVLSTGGGAFMNEHTRALIKEQGLSIWLKADFDVLLKRIGTMTDRPLFKGRPPGDVLTELMAAREPVYAEADLCFETQDWPVDETVDRLILALRAHLQIKT